MIFSSLYASALAGELVLVQDGMARVHLRRDGQLTIHEIIVTQPGQGIGTAILARLRCWPGAHCIVARCPVNLPGNQFYARRGFCLIAVESSRTGKGLNVWRLDLN